MKADMSLNNETKPNQTKNPGTLWLKVVVPVRVPFMGKIDLFQNYTYSIGSCEKISCETTTQKM